MSEVMKVDVWRRAADRRHFIGGSDARVIMGDNEAALLRLWREKRGEVESQDLSVISTHLPPPVITESTALRAATTHILCCS
jgi:predicted phage-related endonuclease